MDVVAASLPHAQLTSSLGKVSVELPPGLAVVVCARPQHRRSRAHLLPACGCLLGVPTQGVAVGGVLGEEAPGSVGHIGGAPAAAPRLADLLAGARLGVAVDALLHGHSAGALLVLACAQAPAQGWTRGKSGQSSKEPH